MTTPPPTSPTGAAPTPDPFGAFSVLLPPPAGPVGFAPLGPNNLPPIGGQTPVTPPDGPLAVSMGVQAPFGGNGDAPPIQNPGGADYTAFSNEQATGRVGDTPYRRIKRGAFQPMASASPTMPLSGLPDGMRAF